MRIDFKGDMKVLTREDIDELVRCISNDMWEIRASLKILNENQAKLLEEFHKKTSRRKRTE